VKVVDIDYNILVIRFRLESQKEFFELLDKVKNGVEGRTWNSKANAWNALPTKKNLEYLKDLGFTFTNPVRELMSEAAPKTFIVPAKSTLSAVQIDESKLVGFFPYQVEGVRFLEGRDGVGVIGDEMGLGKTVQALGYLKIHPEVRPALVVCPAVAKYVWFDAARQWLKVRKSEIAVLSTRTTSNLRGERPLYIINYDILKDWEEVISTLGIQIVIGDEVQYISNTKAQRTKAFVRVAKHVKKKIFLSGTPIKSYPYEFFTVLNLTEPKVFSNQWAYLQRYCDPRHNGFGWTFKGASNQDELRRLIEPLMLRREKAEVLPDLPPKLKQVVPLECEAVEFATYENADKEFREWVKDNLSKKGSAEAKNQVEHLKQLAYLAKRNSILRWMREFLATGQKLVVFAIHLHVLDDIEREFKDISVRIDGKTKPEDRKAIEQQFQKDPLVKLFIGQDVAAGVAITLTASSAVAFLEFPWTNADIDQPADRCHRIGQKDTVNVYFLTANGTIENKIIKHLDTNRAVVKKLLDGKEVQDTDLLANLLEDYLKGEEAEVEGEGN